MRIQSCNSISHHTRASQCRARSQRQAACSEPNDDTVDDIDSIAVSAHPLCAEATLGSTRRHGHFRSMPSFSMPLVRPNGRTSCADSRQEAMASRLNCQPQCASQHGSATVGVRNKNSKRALGPYRHDLGNVWCNFFGRASSSGPGIADGRS